MTYLPTPDEFRQARESLKLGVRDLSRRVGCLNATIRRLEEGALVPTVLAYAVRDALEAAGAKFQKRKATTPAVG